MTSICAGPCFRSSSSASPSCPLTAQRAATGQQPGTPASTSGIDPAAMDTRADACSGFPSFIGPLRRLDGQKIRSRPISRDTAGSTSWQERNNAVLRDILRSRASRRAQAEPQQDRRLLRELHGRSRNRGEGAPPRSKRELRPHRGNRGHAELPPPSPICTRVGMSVRSSASAPTPDFKNATRSSPTARPGRTRAARPRLLPERRREVARSCASSTPRTSRRCSSCRRRAGDGRRAAQRRSCGSRPRSGERRRSIASQRRNPTNVYPG